MTLSVLTICVQAAQIRSRPARQTKQDTGPLSLFPTRTVWTLALNNRLTAPPAYDATRAYFPIEGDRIVAYTLDAGNQEWLATSTTQLQPAAGDGLVFLAETEALRTVHAQDGSLAWLVPLNESAAVPP